MTPQVEVHLFREKVSQQWVIEFRKMGAKLEIVRRSKYSELQARTEAKYLGKFLELEVVSHETNGDA